MPLTVPAHATGEELAYPSATSPPGGTWLLENGQAVSRTLYANLFAFLGTTYGVGDGSTTFNVPDRSGRALIGLGTHVDVDSFADSDGLAVASRTPKHTHGPGTLGGTTGTPSANQAAATPLLGSVPSNTHTHGFTVTTGVTATGNMAYGVTNWWIKA